MKCFLWKKHESGLCSLCKTWENIKHLLLACNKENISNLLRNTGVAYKMDFDIYRICIIDVIDIYIIRQLTLNYFSF